MKLKSPSTIIELVKTWRRQGKTIGFTNGCFDVLHMGHWRLLQVAKKHCHRLIVAVNSDSHCQIIKGSNRPIQPDALRAELAASLVDAAAAVIFSTPTPIGLLGSIKPDVYVLGDDHKPRLGGPDSVPGQMHCGRLVFVPRDENSTTNLIAKMSP